MGKLIPTFQPNEVLNLNWLRKQSCVIDIEHEGMHYRTLWIANFLRKQEITLNKPSMINMLNAAIMKLSKRKIQKFYAAQWDFKKMYTKRANGFFNNFPESGDIEFKVHVYDKNDENIGFALVSYNDIQTVTFESPSAPKKQINVQKVIRSRKVELDNAPQKYVNFNSNDDMEQLIINVCEDYARGLYTIVEICERYDLPYLQFVELVSSNEFARSTYQEAISIAVSLQTNRQLTILQQRIIHLLEQGHVKSKTVTRKPRVRADNLEIEMVMVDEKTTTRDFTLGEMTGMRTALLGETMGGVNELDEFGNMSEEELMDYIAENGNEIGKIDKMKEKDRDKS